MIFKWSQEKNTINICKHHISFETAILAFDDEVADEGYDEEHSISEDRYWLVGRVFDHFIFLVYTMRNETIRLISARPATKGEIRRYYERG